MAFINEENGEILIFNRHTARDLAFKYIFQWNVNGRDVAEFTAEAEELAFTPDDKGYIAEVINGVVCNIEEIDGIIEQLSEKWRKNRISAVCMAIMRIAVYEIKYMEEIPKSVSINEAVEIAKTYDSPSASGFVNGILGRL